MKYLEKKFIIPYGSKQYRDNFDNIFEKKEILNIFDNNGTLFASVELEEEVVKYIEQQATLKKITKEESAYQTVVESIELLQKQHSEEK